MPAYRICVPAPRVATAVPKRNMAYCHPFASFAPFAPVVRRSPATFPSFVNDLAPLFNSVNSIFEDLDRQISTPKPVVRTFQPRFDVREEKDAFHLQGELPGIDQKDLQIEFVDQNTLVVRGRTVREESRGKAPAIEAAETPKAVAAAEPTTTAPDPTAESVPEAAETSSTTSNTKYQKPSVEGEENEDGWTDAGNTPATTVAEAASGPEPSQESRSKTEQVMTATAQQAEPETSFHYWVNERSVGDFHRSFKFPGRVDQDAVTARLTNGVLNVVVPKATQKELRRIRIE